MNAGATAATAAAHKAAEQRREEEEMMTTYGKEDLDGWEFKIMRSATGKFKSLETVQELCRQEARAGWEMVEKFDSSRIRFKRRIDKRSGDAQLGFDPYRTSAGMTEGKLAAIIMSIVVLAIAVAITMAVLLKH